MFEMNYVALLGWPLVILLLFRYFPAQWAVSVSYVGAFLFLPEYNIPLPLADYGKMAAASYGVALATVLFQFDRLLSFRPHWLDIPAFIMFASPFITALSNGLGWYDGLTDISGQGLRWALPYFVGRIYLSNFVGLKRLAMTILAGGLLYVPLCWYESRMSPQLHNMVYGFHALRQFIQSIRWGGYRPTVFLRHGLGVGIVMMSVTLIAFIFWRSGALKKFLGIPMQAVFWILALTTVAVRSTGAIVILLLGISIFLSFRALRSHILLLTLIVFLLSYQGFAATASFNHEPVVSFVESIVGEERAQSLEFRFENEKPLAEHAQERLLFGWGGYGRSFVYDGWGEQITITDSTWVILFGRYGLVGLVSWQLTLILPIILIMRLYPGNVWFHPKAAPMAALAIGIALYVLDSSLNSQYNPLFILACGGITGVVIKKMSHNYVSGTSMFEVERYIESI